MPIGLAYGARQYIRLGGKSERAYAGFRRSRNGASTAVGAVRMIPVVHIFASKRRALA